MTEHCDFVTQVTATAPTARLRPDLVVRLAGGKNVVVDAKVAFSGYLEAMEATRRGDPRRPARRRTPGTCATHIDALAAKAYWEQFTPDAGVRRAASSPPTRSSTRRCSEDPTCWSTRSSADVVIATPSTLIALLRTVAYTWRQEALAANAQRCTELGRELYQRLSTMGGHVDKLGRALNTAVSAYNKAVGSLESRVLVSARQMTDLKVVAPDRGADRAAPRSPRRPGRPRRPSWSTSASWRCQATDLARADRPAQRTAGPSGEASARRCSACTAAGG